MAWKSGWPVFDGLREERSCALVLIAAAEEST